MLGTITLGSITLCYTDRMQTWQYWLLGWVGWGLYFGIEELWALRIKHTPQEDGTLSSMVWRLVRGQQWYHRAASVAVGLFMAVLTYHFLWQPIALH